MTNLLITLIIPIAISSYFVYQVAVSRGHRPSGWLILNALIPFIPLIYFILNAGPKPTSPYAQGLQENALYSAPLSIRLFPESSRASEKGWVYITQHNLYWLPLDTYSQKSELDESHQFPRIGSLQWELKEASVEKKRSYKDGIVNLLLLLAPMDSPSDIQHPVAIVIGTGFELSRVIGLATIISRSQDNLE
jgi:hypothetical protein